MPVHRPRDPAERHVRLLEVRAHCVGLLPQAAGGGLHRPDTHAGEPRRVVPGRHRPRGRCRVELREDGDVLGRAAELVRDDLRDDGPMPLALRRRPEPHGDPAEWVDRHRGPLGVPRLRQGRRALDGGLGERDVAHVRDRRLDDACEADAREPALGAGRVHAGAQFVVARQLAPRGRGRRRSRPSRRGRPSPCGTASPRPEPGCAARARPGRSRACGRRSPASARARSRAAARRTRGSTPRERCS